MNSATMQVEKLEALLARVQRNRSLPRAELAAGARAGDEASFEDVSSLAPAPLVSAPVRPLAAAPQPPQRVPELSVPPVPRPPARASTEPIGMPGATASRPARTPLEMAVENKLERPSMQPQLQSVQPIAAAVPVPVSFARPAADEPVMLADPPPPQASRGIGQVVSKSPPITAQTFGDLLRRSLSLRPR